MVKEAVPSFLKDAESEDRQRPLSFTSRWVSLG